MWMGVGNLSLLLTLACFLVPKLECGLLIWGYDACLGWKSPVFKSWTSSSILWAGDVGQLVECLPGMYKALHLFPSVQREGFLW